MAGGQFDLPKYLKMLGKYNYQSKIIIINWQQKLIHDFTTDSNFHFIWDKIAEMSAGTVWADIHSSAKFEKA